MSEGRTLQSLFSMSKRSKSTSDSSSVARRFSQLMMSGKVNAALRLLSSDCDGKVLPFNSDVMESLVKNTQRNDHLSLPPLLMTLLIHHISFYLISWMLYVCVALLLSSMVLLVPQDWMLQLGGVCALLFRQL